MIYHWLRPLLFQLSPHRAHELALRALSLVEQSELAERILQDSFCPEPRPVSVMGLRFPNPIGLAAGFDKDGRAPRALAALGFGFLELGTVTALSQRENDPPNLFRLPLDEAIINRLGFPNQGAERLAIRLQMSRPSIPVGISIGKSRAVPVEDSHAVLADYSASLRAVAPVADFVVLNISSPNTANLRALQQASLARELLGRMQDELHGRTPLLVKIAPDLDAEGFQALLEVVQRLGLAGVVATNTTIRRDGLTTPEEQVRAMGAGGLSGPPLRARSLAMIRQARATLGEGFTIIGVGGLDSPEGARAMLEAGANLCQLYTAMIFQGPGVVQRIVGGLTTAL